jgi:Fungal Zn(2)-Cys(6) binuclear cluster domain
MNSSLRATQRPKRKRSLDSSTATACDQCHRCKVRCCSGRPSCERCQKNGSTCTYSLGKPLGKPPKAARRKPLRLNPACSQRLAAAPGAAQDEDFGWCSLPERQGLRKELTTVDRLGFVHIRSHRGDVEPEPLPLTGQSNTRDRETSFAPSMQHELTASHAVSAPYDDRLHFVKQGHGDTLFPPPAGITYFSAAEETDIDLDFLVNNDFGRHSHMHAMPGSPSGSVPDTAVVVTALQTANGSSGLSCRPVAVVTPSASNYSMPAPCSQLPVTPSSEPVLKASQMGSTPHSRSFSVPIDANKSSPHHPPTFLETISHLCSKTPSAAQSSPISEALRLARQGL